MLHDGKLIDKLLGLHCGGGGGETWSTEQVSVCYSSSVFLNFPMHESQPASIYIPLLSVYIQIYGIQHRHGYDDCALCCMISYATLPGQLFPA